MGKKFKKLSTNALAATLVASAIVPVAAAETPAAAATLDRVIVTYNGETVSFSVVDYSALIEAEAISPTAVSHVQLSNGKIFTIGEYSTALEALETVAATESYLDNNGTVETVENVKNGLVTEDGIIVDPTPSNPELKVESVSAINENGVVTVTATVTNAEEGATATVEIVGAEGVEPQTVDIAEDGSVTATFELPEGTYTAKVTVGEVSSSSEEFVVIIEEVVAPDEEAPVLNYDGETTIELAYGAEFELPEVTATDNNDEDVEVTYVITLGEEVVETVDTTVAGTYTITYTAVDAAGNEAEPVVVTVVVAEAVVEAPAVTTAKEAIAAYKAATISTYADVAGVEALEAAAQEAIDAVEDAEAKAELQTALDEAKAVNDKVLADAVKAVVDAANAGSVINTKAALDAFGFEYEALVLDDLAGLKTVTTVHGIQAYFVENNFAALIDGAVTGLAGSLVVDDLKLYEALEYGVEAGLLTNVNFDKYFTTYVATIKGSSGVTAADFTSKYVQEKVIDTAAQATVDNAQAAVIALTAASTAQVITAAEALVAVVDETSVYEDAESNLTVAGVSVEVKGQNVKEALTAIIADIKAAKLVYDVIAAAGTGAINQSQLNAALQNAGVERAYEDYIVEYATKLKTEHTSAVTKVDSLSEIQAIIDGENDTIATALVGKAEASPSVETVAAAQAAIDRLLADDPEGTVGGTRPDTVSTLQGRLDVAEAKISSNEAIAAIKALEAGSTKAQVLAALKKVSDAEAVKETPEFDYATVSENNWEAIRAQLVTDNGISGGSTVTATTVQKAVVDAALDAVYALEASSTKEEVLAALTYVDVASKDFDINTVDEANFANIAAQVEGFTSETATQIQEAITKAAIKAVADLENSKPSTDAEVLAALKALDKATINVDKATSADDKFEYSTVKEDLVKEILAALDGISTSSTVKNVQDAVNGVVETKIVAVLTTIKDSPVTADSSTTDKEALLTTLKDTYLGLENVVDANLEAYITDLAAIKGVLTSSTPVVDDVAKVDKKLAAINALVAVNAATTADAVRKELVNFQEAEGTTTYLVKSAQVRLEIAEILLADKEVAFANVAALTTALGEAIDKQGNQLSAVSALTTASENTAVEAALNGLDYAPFEAYTSLSDRLDIAELFLAAHPKNEAGELVDYTTLKDVKAAIDAAIAAFEATPAE